jgi:hypothetical protein
MNGRTGLNYPAVFGLLDHLDLDAAEWWQTFDDIQRMEVAALDAMYAGK